MIEGRRGRDTDSERVMESITRWPHALQGLDEVGRGHGRRAPGYKRTWTPREVATLVAVADELSVTMDFCAALWRTVPGQLSTRMHDAGVYGDQQRSSEACSLKYRSTNRQ
jgi:hypothetical protein